jgi:hypothetical protein
MNQIQFVLANAHPPRWSRFFILACVALPLFSQPLSAQIVDARVLPRGVLRFEFAPHYTNYDRRFALGTPGVTDGEAELLGTDLTADTTGSNLFPAIVSSEQAIRSIIGDPSYRVNVGAFNTVLDADIRRFPFNFSLGLTDRLTVTASMPIITTRMQVAFTNDSSNANVGWNPAVEELAGAEAAAQAAALVNELSAAVVDVESRIAAGDFGCPSGATCAQAQATLARATALRDNLLAMTGLGDNGGTPPPFAPLATSAAGVALTSEVSAVIAELQTLAGISFSGTLSLPQDSLSTENVNQIFSSPALGYDADPLGFVRATHLGDAELGVRYGLIQRPAARIAAVATVRFPTGQHDRADNYVDLGQGDKQWDVVAGIEAAFDPGSVVGLSLGASYTLQLPHTLTRRISSPDSLLVPASAAAVVQRNLGDEIRVRVYPSLRLNPAFRVYGSATYFRKGHDSFSDGSGQAVEPLERETKMEAFSFGGGIAYRTAPSADGSGLPIEAGLTYRSTFSGSGGLTPKANDLALYLRLFYRLWNQGGGTPQQQD